MSILDKILDGIKAITHQSTPGHPRTLDQISAKEAVAIAIKYGTMYKKGYFNDEWKIRFFVVTAERVYWFEDEQSAFPQGQFDLDTICETNQGRITGGGEYGIQVNIPGRSFCLSTDSAEESISWYAILRSKKQIMDHSLKQSEVKQHQLEFEKTQLEKKFQDDIKKNKYATMWLLPFSGSTFEKWKYNLINNDNTSASQTFNLRSVNKQQITSRSNTMPSRSNNTLLVYGELSSVDTNFTFQWVPIPQGMGLQPTESNQSSFYEYVYMTWTEAIEGTGTYTLKLTTNIPALGSSKKWAIYKYYSDSGLFVPENELDRLPQWRQSNSMAGLTLTAVGSEEKTESFLTTSVHFDKVPPPVALFTLLFETFQTKMSEWVNEELHKPRRCNKFTGFNRYRAYLCKECGEGAKKDNCVVCEKWVGCNAFDGVLCEECSVDGKQSLCCKCGQDIGIDLVPHRGSNAYIMGILCLDCGFGSKQQNCCRMKKRQ